VILSETRRISEASFAPDWATFGYNANGVESGQTFALWVDLNRDAHADLKPHVHPITQSDNHGLEVSYSFLFAKLFWLNFRLCYEFYRR